MFQQDIEVTQPHLKPIVYKSSVLHEDASPDQDSVIPLEYLTAYELELQQTILQLNSELGDSSDDSSFEDSDSCADTGNYTSHSDENQSVPQNNLVHSSRCLENSSNEECVSEPRTPPEQALSHECIANGQTSGDMKLLTGDADTNEFDDYELRLKSAVHELASLSDILVGSYSSNNDAKLNW